MVTAQVAGRPVGVMLGIDTALNPFSIRPSYQALLQLAGRGTDEPLHDPALRARVLADGRRRTCSIACRSSASTSSTRWNRMFQMGDPPNYEPEESDSIAAMAAAVEPHAGRGRL